MPTCEHCFTDYSLMHSDVTCRFVMEEQRNAAATKILELLQYLPEASIQRILVFEDLPWLTRFQ